MHTKPYLVGCMIFLTVAAAGTKHAIPAGPAVSASAVTGSMARWKSTPEDSTPWRREPFKPPEARNHAAGPAINPVPIGSVTDLALQGIMQSNTRYYAIINGRTVKSGDRIEGWTVAGINRYRVTVRRENEKKIFDIYQGSISRGNQ